MGRRAARTDANHAAVRQALRLCGWTVIDTSRVGAGFPDLLAARAGRLELIEVKDGAKPRSRQQFTPAEHELRDALAMAGVRVHVICDIAEIATLGSRWN